MTLSKNDNKTEKSEGSWTRLICPHSSIPNILTPQTSKTCPETLKNNPLENEHVKELPVLKPGDEILGKYLVEKVISGGMGHVYIATHKYWHRKIAIKSPNKAMLSKKSLFARILREANAWIDMGLHPNIAYCYYVKKIKDVPHIMVEYVDGGNLRSWIGRHVKTRFTDYKQALNLAVQFCHGMEFAHFQGMIHRDIKPENILLTKTGILKITDFGLVRRSDSIIELENTDRKTTCKDKPLLTQIGVSMGTPPYMSPEQRLNSHDVDERADIFSFGVCLYEMFCKCRPDLQKCHEPPCPQILSKDKDFPKKLAGLIIKCVDPDIEKRYLNFAQVRIDLSKVYHELFNEQSPYASLDILPPAADSLNNKGVSFIELERFKDARNCFEKAVSEDNFHPQANWNIGNFRILNQSLLFLEHQDQTIEMLRAALQESRLSEEAIENRIQKAIETKDFFQAIAVSFTGIKANVNALAFSPCSNIIAAGCSDHSILVWAVGTGRMLNTLTGHTNSVNSVLFFPGGDIIVSAGSDKTIRMWDYETGQELDVLKGHTGLISSLCFSPCGRFLVSGSDDKTVKIWNAKTGVLQKSLESHQYGINAVCFSKNGKWIASASNDKSIILWNAETGEALVSFKGHEDSIDALAFSPDVQLLASGSRDKTIKLWNLKTGNLQATIKGHKHWVTALEFSPDNRFLISSGRDQTIRVWNGKTGHHIKTLEGHKHEVSCVTFSPDGQYLASGSWDNKVNLWNINVLNPQLTLPQDYVSLKKRFIKKQQKLTRLKKLISRKKYSEAYKKILDSWKQEGFGRQSSFYELFTKIQAKGSVLGIKEISPFIRIKAHTDNVSSLCFSPDSKKLVSASSDNTAKLWSINDGKLLMTTDSMLDHVSSVVFSIDGNFIATGSSQIKLWDIKTGESKSFNDPGKGVSSLAFSPDGNFLAAGSRDQTVKIWDINNNKAIHIFKDNGQRIDSVAFSKDSRFIAGSAGPVVRIWKTKTGALVRELKGHKLFMTPVVFSPDGNFLGSVGNDNSIKLWDLSTLNSDDCTAQNISGHTEDILALDFSPDSRFIISGSADYSIKIWDVKKKTLFKTLEGHTAHVGTVAFSPDGRFIASGSRDNTIKLWLIIPELSFNQDVFMPYFSEKQNLALLENLISQNKNKSAFQKLMEIWEQEEEKEKQKLFPVLKKLKSKGIKTGIRSLIPIATLKAHTSYVESVCFSPDSRFIASGSWDKTVRIWDMNTDTLLTTLKWHVSHVESVAFSPDSSLLASGSRDSSIVIWDTAEMKLIKILEGHQGRVNSVSFLQNNKILVSGGEDNCIKFWNIKTGKIIKNVQGQEIKVNAVAFSQKDRFFAIGDDKASIRFISLKGKKINRIIKAGKGSVNALAFSPNESMLASAWADKKVLVWDINKSKLLHSWQNHTQEVRTVAFSPDNELLASGGDDHKINLWDIKTGNIIQTLDAHMKSVSSIAFSPDGCCIASGSEDNTVRLWLIIPELSFLDS